MMHELFRKLGARSMQRHPCRTFGSPPRHAAWLWSLTALGLLAGACSPAARATPPEGEPTDEWVDVDLDLGPGELDFTEMQTGLDGLSGYKAILTIAFEGTEAGAPSQWSDTYEMLHRAEPDAWQLTVTHSDAAAPSEFTAQMEGVYYEVGPEGQCSGYVTESQEPTERPEPADLLAGLLGAEAAGHETLAGVEADHYTFDERALAQDGLTDSEGELWLATDGGYLLRYVRRTQADERYFGKGAQGTATWDYQLSEVNAPVEFTLPPDCPPGMVDAPLLADAADVFAVPGYLEYTTASNVADAFAFYETELATLGWTEDLLDPTGMPGFEGMEDLAAIEEQMRAMGLAAPEEEITDETGALKQYILNDRVLVVDIDKVDGVTRVTLLLDRRTE